MDNKDKEEPEGCVYMGERYSPGEDMFLPDHCVVCRHGGNWEDVPAA